MSHALIIDDNMLISRAVEDRLIELGFHTFDHAWTEEQAVSAAERRPPNLVVLGEWVANGSAVNVARQIPLRNGVPILMLIADGANARCSVPKGDAFEGPFFINEIETAAELACAPIYG